MREEIEKIRRMLKDILINPKERKEEERKEEERNVDDERKDDI